MVLVGCKALEETTCFEPRHNEAWRPITGCLVRDGATVATCVETCD